VSGLSGWRTAVFVLGKELADVRRDVRWLALAGGVLLLLVLALWQGLQTSHEASHEHVRAEGQDRLAWLAQGSKNPHAAAHFGQYAFKPIGPLALADPGVDAFVGSSIWLEAHKQNDAQFRAARDGSLLSRMGELTIAGVFQTVFPLLTILLGYASVSGEREAGTLRQVIVQGVPLQWWLLGKALAAMSVLVALTLLSCLAILLGTLFWGWSSGHALALDTLFSARALFMLGGYLVYFAGFLFLAMAASCACRRSRSALLALLLFWVLNCFLVPRLYSEWIQRSDPLPDAQTFRAAIAADKRQAFSREPGNPLYLAFVQRVLQTYGVDRVEDLPISLNGLALREDDHAGYRVFDRHFAVLQQQIEAQDRRFSGPGWLFPLLALQPWSMAVAGTDSRHFHHFTTAAEQHRRRLQEIASQDLIEHAGQTTAYRAGPALWARMPRFSYDPPALAWALSAHWENALRLLFWCLLSLTGLWLAARRLDLR